ncbi:hypothetical protein AY601_4118 [Pedobacter cryoconitis]|uniref:Uncharacterized protein n=1 Tax=Pedobacter cryoconitis TaxID=188932 RepID=A0A127VJ84_9SPHI|nr:helix-turn-helix domain-containing protein [Pedobacter cryoconitis]AMQ00969.1 hypothetical protein AY601_4118 [Pedobacter cryoconitis]
MEGISIVSTELLSNLISKIEMLGSQVQELSAGVKQTKLEPYMTVQDLMDYTHFSRDWVTDHKHEIGCRNVCGKLMFKRKDVDSFMDKTYYKVGNEIEEDRAYTRRAKRK